MTPEEKSLLERTARLAEENNKILRSLQRSKRWGTIIHIIYWVIIIGLSVGSYFAIQPLLNTIPALLGATQSNPSLANDLLQQLQSFMPR
jgi:hypothetical protein